jgi:hypothetical protein
MEASTLWATSFAPKFWPVRSPMTLDMKARSMITIRALTADRPNEPRYRMTTVRDLRRRGLEGRRGLKGLSGQNTIASIVFSLTGSFPDHEPE